MGQQEGELTKEMKNCNGSFFPLLLQNVRRRGHQIAQRTQENSHRVSLLSFSFSFSFFLFLSFSFFTNLFLLFLSSLPPFNEDLMRTVVRETKGLEEDLRSLAGNLSRTRGDLNVATEMLTKHGSVKQNKRCLQAYLNDRADRIRHMCWDLGAVPPQEIKDNMSRAELEFYRGYSKVRFSFFFLFVFFSFLFFSFLSSFLLFFLFPFSFRQKHFFFFFLLKVLTDYKAHYLDLDLTAAPLPPKELFVEVRVVKDCGELQTEHGMVNLQKNSQHFLRRTDVEHLIKQGYLLHLGS